MTLVNYFNIREFNSCNSGRENTRIYFVLFQYLFTALV